MSTNIKTWQDRAQDEGIYEVVRAGQSTAHMQAEIAELRAALAATQADLEEWRFTNKVDELERKLAQYEAQMLRMATCAGEFARDACKAQAPSAPVDVCAEMRAICSACGGTGDVHSIDGEWRGSCDCQTSAPVAPDQGAAFEAWAKREGLIQESHGIRSTSSACAVAQRAFDAGAALSVKAEPIAWIESEPSVRGCDPRSFIHGVCNTVMFHTKSPMTTNPVWPLYLAAPTPPTTGKA